MTVQDNTSCGLYSYMPVCNDAVLCSRPDVMEGLISLMGQNVWPERLWSDVCKTSLWACFSSSLPSVYWIHSLLYEHLYLRLTLKTRPTTLHIMCVLIYIPHRWRFVTIRWMLPKGYDLTIATTITEQNSWTPAVCHIPPPMSITLPSASVSVSPLVWGGWYCEWFCWCWS